MSRRGTVAGDVDEVEEFRRTILARQVEAEEAMVRGDAGPRMALWSRRDPVTLFGAVGMSESGWEQLSETFTWVASRFSNVSDFRFDVEEVGVSGDLAYTLGFERFKGSIAGRPVEEVTVRVTHIYRREDGAWKIVHRHGDNPLSDPRSREAPPAFVAVPGPEDALRNPLGGPLSFMARGEQTMGALTAFESTAAPGEGPPLHRHAAQDEAIYVLEGRLRVRLEGDHEAPAGSLIFIPRGVVHTWQNAGEDPARILVAFTPAAVGMEQFFERSAELGEEASAAEAFERFAGDAGMEVLGPPLAQAP